MHFQFTQELGPWAYLLLALLVMVEGPVATLAAAVAASAGLMKPGYVFLAASTGNLVSDGLWYSLGYLGKVEWIERYGGWAGVRRDMILRLTSDIQKNAPRLLFLAKLTLGFTIPALVATGLARVPLRRWMGVLIIAETIWTGALVYLGVHFGQYVKRFERSVEIVAVFGVLLFVGILIFYISHLRQRSTERED